MSPKEYICHFPGCNTSYLHKEHLSRHETQHGQRSFQCSNCGREFSRSDALRRHMRQIHGVNGPVPDTKHACTHCRRTKSRCHGGPPCTECQRRGISCSLDGQTETQGSKLPSRVIDGQLSPSHIPPSIGAARSEKESHFLRLYFRKFHPYWPFIHQGSFNEDRETPFLVQSMVVIGLWVSEEENAQSAANDLHNTLALEIRKQKGAWFASIEEDRTSACSWPIPTYQGILLHIIFALLHGGSGTLGLDLKPSLTSANTEIFNSLVVSCKRLGMLYYPNILAQYSQSDPAPYVWLRIEEVKRFNLAVYRVYQACSKIGKEDRNTHEQDITATPNSGLTAKDLQFPFPRNNRLWRSCSKGEWDAAATDGVFCHLLDDTMDEEWISKVDKDVGVDWGVDWE